MYHGQKILYPIYIYIIFPYLAYFPVLKIETVSQTTRRHIPENSYLQLKSNKIGIHFSFFPHACYTLIHNFWCDECWFSFKKFKWITPLCTALYCRLLIRWLILRAERIRRGDTGKYLYVYSLLNNAVVIATTYGLDRTGRPRPELESLKGPELVKHRDNFTF
jgi:hypothetical protein